MCPSLNAEADKHAGEFRHQFGSYQPLIPLSPTRLVALDIDGKRSTAASNRLSGRPFTDPIYWRPCNSGTTGKTESSKQSIGTYIDKPRIPNQGVERITSNYATTFYPQAASSANMGRASPIIAPSANLPTRISTM